MLAITQRGTFAVLEASAACEAEMDGSCCCIGAG